MKVNILIVLCFVILPNSLRAQESGVSIYEIIQATSVQIMIPAKPSKITREYRKLSASYQNLQIDYFVPGKTGETPQAYFNASYFLYNLQGTDTTHKYDFNQYSTSYHDIDGYVVYKFKDYAVYKNNQRVTFSITIRRASNNSVERTVIMVKKYFTEKEYNDPAFATVLNSLDNSFEYGDIRAKY